MSTSQITSQTASDAPESVDKYRSLTFTRMLGKF